jgi:hypothetical protein
MSAICSSHESCVSDHSETSESLAVRAQRLAGALEKDVRDFVVAEDQNLGDIEIQLERPSRELLRVAAERAAQKKAGMRRCQCVLCANSA